MAEVLYFRTTASPSSGRGALILMNSSICEEASITVLGADFQALINFRFWVNAVEMEINVGQKSGAKRCCIIYLQ